MACPPYVRRLPTLRAAVRRCTSFRYCFRPSRTLTDGADGFLPGVPLGCLRMWDLDLGLRPRPFGGNSGPVGPGPREAMSDHHTQRTNARGAQANRLAKMAERFVVDEELAVI